MISFDIFCTTSEALLWWSNLHTAMLPAMHVATSFITIVVLYHPSTAAQAVARLDGELRDVDAERMHRRMIIFANTQNNVDVENSYNAENTKS
jgi:hypothetical protein